MTGTFKHESATVLDLHVGGLDGPIGTTANHPFWSEDRQEFVRADDLQPGERLRTPTSPLPPAGEGPGVRAPGTAQVLAVVARAAPEPVYNLEVQYAHVYHVATDGILVHNGSKKACKALAKAAAKKIRRRNSAGQPINSRGQFVSGAGGDSAAARAGREAHRRFDALVDSKRGWTKRPRIKGPDGRVHIPDATTPNGRPVELKAKTTSGIKEGRRQINRYKDVTGKSGRVIYYDPMTGELLYNSGLMGIPQCEASFGVGLKVNL